MSKYEPKFQWISLPFISLAFHIYCGYKIIGHENIPTGGCVVCPNHSDTIDPPLVAACIGNKYKVRVMAKKELFTDNFFGHLITWLGAFPVDRNRADITAIKTALQTVRDGDKLVIFPQGTRDAADGETKQGAAMLAVKTKAPIVPVYISENKGFRTHAHVIFGKPFHPNTSSKNYHEISNDILKRIYDLKKEIK